MQVVDITAKFVENSIYFLDLTAQKLNCDESMRNQDKQAKKFGGFPFFVKIYNHFLKFFTYTC